MNVAYISLLSALAGSLVGGLTTGLTTWISQIAQARTAQRAHDLARREELFKDFIVMASTAYGEAVVSSEPKIQEIIALYALISRMRVICSPHIVETADKVMLTTVGTYFAPNRTIPELHELLKNGAAIDPLREFAEAARHELRVVR